MSDKINQRIASELSVGVGQVAAAVELLGEGATVPFIARYRKERTGGLDDTQLRKLEERLGYLRELEDRRATVLKSIGEQGKLTPELARAIGDADTKVALEDLYAPYRPKRRTKAQIAREAGLEPLAEALLANPALLPDAEAAKFIDGEKGVADAKAALDGARHILIERMAEDAEAGGRAARVGVDGGRARLQGGQGQGGRGRQVLRLFRLRPAPQGHALAPHPRHAARAQRGRARPRPRCAARAGQAAPGRGQDQGRLQHRRPGTPRRCLARRHGAPGLEGPHGAVDLGRSAGAPQGEGRRRGDRGVLAQPARTCCWRRRPARARPWGSTRASAPACKVAVVDGTGKLVAHRHDLPARAERTTGTARWPRWPRCASSTGWSW